MRKLLIILSCLLTSSTVCSNELPRYSSQEHFFTVNAPDRLWQISEHSLAGSANVVMAPPGEDVLVTIGHFTVPGTKRLDRPTRSNEFTEYIRRFIPSLSDPGSSIQDIDATRLAVQNGQATITFEYTSRPDNSRVPHHNRTVAKLFTTVEGEQHLYLIRAAAPEDRFSFWEGDFQRAAESFAFTGLQDPTVYSSRSWPWWVWPAGAGLLLFVLLYIRGRRASTINVTTNIPARDDYSSPGYAAAPSVLTHASESLPIPEQTNSTLNVLMGVVDHDSMAAELDAADKAHTATLLSEEAMPSASPTPSQGFWKCQCGRINSDDDQFCARCNSDKPRHL